MTTLPTPPETYQAFVRRYPRIGQAWEELSQAGKEGPMDVKTVRLVRLALAIGAMREGAVHANVRKALAQGISPEEVQQVVALSAATIGLPAAVAVFSWVNDVLNEPRL